MDRKSILFGEKILFESQNIYNLFLQQAEVIPNNVAIISEERTLTYKQVVLEVEKLSGVLKEKIKNTGEVIGLSMDRTENIIISFFAILKIGCIYCPIDTNYPNERIKYILEDSNISYVITDEMSSMKIKSLKDNVILFDINKCLEVVDIAKTETVPSEALNAYIMYTSGTTGVPKGVCLKHDDIQNLLLGWNHEAPLNNDLNNFTFAASYSFNSTIRQIVISLLNGRRLYIIPENTRKTPLDLYKYFTENQINVFDGTLSQFMLIFPYLKDNFDEFSIKRMHFVGEKFPKKIYLEIIDLYKTSGREMPEIINVYGSTETTVNVAIHKTKFENADKYLTIPIGIPLANKNVYLLDDKLSLVDIGEVGEICVSGKGVANGYINKREISNEKFITDVIYGNDVMYRTGDLAKINKDGLLEYVGRNDSQVKINGQRIELSEIENIVNNHEKIKQSVAILKEKSENDKYICLYYLEKELIDEDEIIVLLREKLPVYMLPKKYIKLDKFPLNSNSKIDLLVLKNKKDDEFVKIENNNNLLEYKILQTFMNNLEKEKINFDFSFHDNNGDSLNAIKIALELGNYGIDIEPSDIAKPFLPMNNIIDIIVNKNKKMEINKELIINQLNNAQMSETNIEYKIISQIREFQEDPFSWKDLDCFLRPLAILMNSYKEEYFFNFLLITGYYYSFLPKYIFKEFTFYENINEKMIDKFFYLEDILKESFNLDITKVEYGTEQEFHKKLQESIIKNKRILVPSNLTGLDYYTEGTDVPHRHYFIIKGFDDKRRIYYILDNMHIEFGQSTQYKDFALHYKRLYDASQKYFMDYQSSSRPYYIELSVEEESNDEKSDLFFLRQIKNNFEKEIKSEVCECSFLENELYEEVVKTENSYIKDNDFLFSFFARVNLKNVFYHILFKHLQANVKESYLDKIEELKKIKEKLISFNEEIKNNSIDIAFVTKQHLNEHKILITKDNIRRRNLYEKLFREEFVSIMEDNSVFYETIKNKIGDFYTLNLRKVNFINEKLELVLKENKNNSLWKYENNAPQILTKVKSDCLSFNTKIIGYGDKKVRDLMEQSGIILSFENDKKLLFGLSTLDNMAIYDISEKNPVLFEKRTNEKNVEIKVEVDNNLYEFYSNGIKIYQTEFKQKLSEVGIFFRSWDLLEHRADFENTFLLDKTRNTRIDLISTLKN